MTILIGTSGFCYPHWEQGVFYPADLPKGQELEYYCQHFDTVELNVTFYRLPSKETFAAWQRRTPEVFRFALKGSRYITHVKRLKDVKDALHTFFDHARPLLSKTACILWQLPPSSRLNFERLQAFVRLLKRRKGPKHAFEFREASWFVPEVIQLLTNAGMTICRADWPPCAEALTGDFPFEYVRRHGPKPDALYASAYTTSQLKKDATDLLFWKQAGKDALIFFNNDAQGFAVKNALELKEMLLSKIWTPLKTSSGPRSS